MSGHGELAAGCGMRVRERVRTKRPLSGACHTEFDGGSARRKRFLHDSRFTLLSDEWTTRICSCISTEEGISCAWC